MNVLNVLNYKHSFNLMSICELASNLGIDVQNINFNSMTTEGSVQMLNFIRQQMERIETRVFDFHTKRRAQVYLGIILNKILGIPNWAKV